MIAPLALALLLSTPAQAPAAPVAPPAQAPQLVLHSLRDATYTPAPDSLRARIEAARAAARPAPAVGPTLRERQQLLALRPQARDDHGSASRRAALGVGGYLDASDTRLGAAGRRAALSRPPQLRRRR